MTTRTQDIEAGAALDAEIGRRLFGIKKLHYPHGDDWPYYIPSGKPWRTHSIDARPLPGFSTDIAAAWLVVERMTDLRQPFNRAPEGASDHWMPPATRFAYAWDDQRLWACTGAEAAEWICRAALAALDAG